MGGKILKLKSEELVEVGMETKRINLQLDRIADETEKSTSGKTKLMGMILNKLSFDKSGLVIQESEELFSDSDAPVIVTNANLKDLARNALLTDLDHFVIGEIKGTETKYFINAADTGHRC